MSEKNDLIKQLSINVAACLYGGAVIPVFMKLLGLSANVSIYLAMAGWVVGEFALRLII